MVSKYKMLCAQPLHCSFRALGGKPVEASLSGHWYGLEQQQRSARTRGRDRVLQTADADMKHRNASS